MNSFDRPVTRKDPEKDLGGGQRSAIGIGSEREDARQGDARQGDRDSLLLVARVRIGNDLRDYEARVRNLSEAGLMLELDKVLDIGTPIRIDVRGIGEMTGKVAWSTEGRIGVSLDTRIDPRKARKPVGKTITV